MFGANEHELLLFQRSQPLHCTALHYTKSADAGALLAEDEVYLSFGKYKDRATPLPLFSRRGYYVS